MNTTIAYTTLTFNTHNNILLDKQEYVTIRKYSADVMNRTSTVHCKIGANSRHFRIKFCIKILINN